VLEHPTALEADPRKPKPLRVRKTSLHFQAQALPEGSSKFKMASFHPLGAEIDMKVIGVNTSPSEVRYAILSFEEDGFQLLNRSEENRLVFPSGYEDISEKVLWLHEEFGRIFDINKDIPTVAIRMNPYGLLEKKATRVSTHLDAVVLLTAKLHGKDV
jgi:hypothetical protein